MARSWWSWDWFELAGEQDLSGVILLRQEQPANPILNRSGSQEFHHRQFSDHELALMLVPGGVVTGLLGLRTNRFVAELNQLQFGQAEN